MVRNPMPLFVFVACAAAAPAAAQLPFSASLIPDSLKKDAHCVVREDHEIFTVSSPGKAVYTIHEVVTILDEQGSRDLYFVARNDKFHHLEDVHLDVYDANGLAIQHVKQKEMETYSFGENLVDDGMMTVFKVSAPSYPVTVETDESIDFKGIYEYPPFALPRDGHSYVEADYILTVPSSIGIRFHNNLLACKPVKAADPKGNQVFTWKVNDFMAKDDASNYIGEQTPLVRIVPSEFEIDDRPGDMTSWKALGQWTYDLNQAAFALPDASRGFYRNLVAGATSDREKARIIYNYLQDNFRYVSIQLGIGGLKSFPASFTEQKKYGDCKALSTYMKACLDAVGVKSYTALVNAGEDSPPLDPAFPYDGFDHVILCIPGTPDSTWLECTSKYTDFGVLGAFTENRYALLVTENGGVLVRTPRSTEEENTSSMSTRVALSPDGSGNARVSIHARGEDKFYDVGSLYEADKDAQRKYLMDGIYHFKQPDTCQVTLGDIHKPILDASLYMSFETVPDFSSGSKMFISPRLYHQWTRTLPDVSDRHEDYYFLYPLQRTDTTAFVLPAGYVVDQLPEGMHASCPYASYSSKYWIDSTNHTVYSTATISIPSRRVPLADYASLYDVFGQILKDVDQKIVITQP